MCCELLPFSTRGPLRFPLTRLTRLDPPGPVMLSSPERPSLRVFHDEFHVRDIRVLNNDGDRAGRERRQRELKEARVWSREGR